MNPPRDRSSTVDGRIIITGTGRAGTTFLVQLFTALGFNTGFTREETSSVIDEISYAGLERALVDDLNPYVIKSPWFADYLESALDDGKVKISAALIPIRSLFDAAESRRRVYWELRRRGMDPHGAPGSLWHVQQPSEQEGVLATQFYKIIFALVKGEVPVYIMEFPRLARDGAYLFRKLELLLNDHGVSHSEFLSAYADTVRPELIHEF